MYRITPSTPNAHHLPGADPGEGYVATKDQLRGGTPTAGATTPMTRGFAVCDQRLSVSVD